MAASVTVNVNVQDQGVLTKLNAIDAAIEKLKRNSNVSININAAGQSGGVAGATATITNLGNAFWTTADAAKASAKLINGELRQTAQTVQVTAGTSVETITKYGKTSNDVTQKIVVDQKKQSDAVKREQAEIQKQFTAIEKEADKAAKAEIKLTEETFAKRREARAEEQKLLEAETAAADQRINNWTRVAKIAAAAVVVKATKEALSTMKEVDSELANIRKVTGESEENIRKLGEAAYDTASKYGVSANEYLEAATAFAKAGKSNYAELAEVAIKTQLVGDVTQETATKFLIAADAAYKMKGDATQLMSTLDKANEIDNNYATSIEKIAQGFPVVANTAHMANMSIDELMAALGTITATTQQTGTKAATALRALILNITGEVGALLEDEQGQFEVTTDGIKSMSDALLKYGNDAVKAARESGELIDPMEAIASLAQAWKNGDLTNTQLENILMGVGGKLRTEQLTALVTNFDYDMYEGMLLKMQNAAGSADKEIVNLLDTWKAKTEQLNNTWTKFVSHLIDSRTIKDGIDSLRGVISMLDDFVSTPFGDAAVKVTALTVAFTKLNSAFKTFGESSYGKNFVDTIQTIKDVVGKDGLLGALEKLGPKISSTFKGLFETFASGGELATSLGAWAVLIGELIALVNIVESRKAIDKDRFQYQYGRSTEEMVGFSDTLGTAMAESAQYGEEAVAASLKAVVDKYRSTYTTLKNQIAEGGDTSLFEKEFGFKVEDFIDSFEDAEKLIEGLTDGSIKLTSANEDLGISFQDTTTDINDATDALEAFSAAMKTAKGTAASGYESAYKAFLQDWEAGMTDSTAINAVADMFLSPEMKSALGYNAKAMGEFLSGELFQAIFAGGNAGANLANYLYDNLGQFPGLSEITKFSIDAAGNLDFTYASVEKLASALHISLPLMQALLDAVDVYGEEMEMGWEGTQELASKLQELGVNAGESGMKLQDVVSGLHQIFSEASASEISAYVSALGKAGLIEGFENIDLSELGAIIDAVLSGIEPKPKVETEVTADGDQAAEAVQEAADEANPEVEVTTTVNDEASEALNEIEDKDVTITMHGEDDGFVELKDEWHGVESKDETLEFVGEDNGLTSLAETWHGVQSKTVTLTVNVVQNGSIPQFAEGTKDAPGGVALVNEKGPELISDNGKAYIANGGKPAIVTLGKGAIVLTAEETRQAIGNISVNNGIPAYATGIPRTSAAKSSGGGGGSTKTKKEKASSSKETDPWEELEKELKEDLKDFDEIADWYHNQKRHEEEVETYQEAIARIEQARDKYREAGYEESSAEMARLANEIFDYEEDIRKAYSPAIDDLEDELDLIDEQIELAENQGNLEKALQLQKQAQEKVSELIEAYRKAGYADTSEQILELANKGYDYTGDTDSTMKKLWSNLISALKDMRESQDDANDLAEKQLAVDEAREALQNAQKQRTVRVFNPVTGQWEWIADAKSISDAEEKLATAEKNLIKEQQSQELDALQKLANNNGSIDDVTIGPGIASILANASPEQLNAYAAAIGALTGGGKITADTTSRSVFDSVDSHNNNSTNYVFNGVTIDASTAENATLADLVQMISPLAITNNMPA